MELSKIETADGRAHTDASLEAERAGSDCESAARTRRGLDDLIERDRILADLRLMKFRDRADRVLSRERFDSPSPNSSVSLERDQADERKKDEREMSDGLLQGERHRSDVAVETERNEYDALQLESRARRQLTDDQLSTERSGADMTTAALSLIKNTLADARTQQGRGIDVLSIVAHDLRSPLSVISMTAESLTQMTPATFKPALARPIMSAIARMERMFSARGIAFNIVVPAGAIVLSFDHDRIVQVLSNLLVNAMKFTPHGGNVTLQVERQAPLALFALSDTGPGIPADALAHVFERFWQIDSNTRRGLGLGLHICEKIIQAHEGRIWAESEPGNGATFRFTLPLNE